MDHEHMSTTQRGPLRRRTDDKVIAGVCSGIADYFGIDPVIVRLAVVALTLTGGAGVMAYIIAWLVIPAMGDETPHYVHLRAQGHGSLAGIVLGGIGLLLLFDQVRPWRTSGDVFLPLLLLGGGAYLLFRERDGDDDPTPPYMPPYSPPPPPPAPPRSTAEAPSTAPDATTEAPSPTDTDTDTDTGSAPDTTSNTSATEELDPLLLEARRLRDGSDLTTPVPPWSTKTTWVDEAPSPVPGPVASPETDWVPSEWSMYSGYPPPAPQPPARVQRQRSFLGGAVVGIVLVGLGVVWLLDASGTASFNLQHVVAATVMVVGGGLVVGAFYGRSRGLIALGVLLTVALCLIAALDVPFQGGYGDRSYVPRSVKEVVPYHLTGGDMTIDLRSLPSNSGAVNVIASVAFGELTVLVPQDAGVRVHAHVAAGDIVLPGGRNADGIDLDRTYRASGDEGAPTYNLNLEVGFGEVVVR